MNSVKCYYSSLAKGTQCAVGDSGAELLLSMHSASSGGSVEERGGTLEHCVTAGFDPC